MIYFTFGLAIGGFVGSTFILVLVLQAIKEGEKHEQRRFQNNDDSAIKK